jgi:hypothetical protein
MEGCYCRCGRIVLEQGSTIEATAGPLRDRIRGPVRLCQECSRRLVNWLHGGTAGSTAKLLRRPPTMPVYREPGRELEPVALWCDGASPCRFSSQIATDRTHD